MCVSQISRGEWLEHLRRKEAMTSACAQNNYMYRRLLKNRYNRYLKSVLVDEKHRVLYCLVPKVGSTNWLRLLVALDMEPVGNPSNLPTYNIHNMHNFKHLYNYKPFKREELLSNYTKLLFVRHPFERLLSAYRSIFEKNLNEFGAKHRLMFGRFRTYIAQQYGNNTPDTPQGGDTVDTIAPNITFKEFVTYLTDPRTLAGDPFSISYTGSLNPHWAPVLELCNPCKVKYDIIGMHRTMDADTEFVLKRLNLNHLVKFPSYGNKANYTGSRIEEYYSQLSDSDINNIRNLYAVDFALFQFNATIGGWAINEK